ncbi:hypothetical protein H1R20_g2295, partial [Candolleomyces eurysporus]
MSWYNPTDSYAPPSSPGSSPETLPADSSPASSPGIEPLDLEDEPPALDPFAGASGSRRVKRVNMSPNDRDEDQRAFKKARYVPRNGLQSLTQEDRIWADESTRAYEEHWRIFHLAGKDLTRVDTQFIRDLKSMVVLPSPEQAAGPSRKSSFESNGRKFDHQAPEIAARQIRRTFSRQESKNSAILPGERDENIHLYLAKNRITKLPNELWTLEHLTILSLRGNKITYLPPEIGNLKNLRDLNVSANRFKYLPSELNNLTSLVSIHVHPNKLFLEPPPTQRQRPVSEVECVMPSSVPSLVELCLRVLASPPTEDMQLKLNNEEAPPKNVLEYYLPLDHKFMGTISQPLLKTLDACSPGWIPREMIFQARDCEDESMDVNGIGRCANPNHTSLFVHHAEQRYSWEASVAGLSLGGVAPFRWRGCCRGCLSFLDVEEKAEEEEEEDALEIQLQLEPVAFDGTLPGFEDD